MPSFQLSDATVAAALHLGISALTALGILIVGWMAAAWVERLLRRLFAAEAPHIDITFGLMLASMARYGVLILVVLSALSTLGVQTTSVLAALGAAGLAIGLALQGTLANIAAGLMLLFLRPFHVGDSIDADGVGGTVTGIGLFTVELTTGDGVYMSVPNSALWNKPIKNYSRLAERQLSVAVGIPYGGDLAKALAVLRGLLDDPRVLHTPSPAVAVTDLGENAVTVTLTCWARAADLGVLGNDLRLRATERLGNAGFAPPFPRREVRVEPQERPQAA